MAGCKNDSILTPSRGRVAVMASCWLAACLGAFVPAATPLAAGSGTRLAYIIANGDYANLGRLNNPNADGELVAASLRNSGFKVVLLKNVGDAAFRAALRQIARETPRAESALVYYAGHGVQVGGVNYLLPVDLPVPEGEDDIRFSSVSADEVLSVIKSPYKIIVLDACRENPLLGKVLSHGRGASYKRGLAPVAPPAESAGGIFIAYSTQSDAVALDGDGANSSFAESFAKYVGARTSIDDMFATVTRDVLSKTNGAQRPFKYASMDAIYCLPGECTPVAPPLPAAAPAPGAQLPMTIAALEDAFKRLNAVAGRDGRRAIEDQLWQALRSTLPSRFVFGVNSDATTQKTSIFALHPDSVSVDGQRISVTTETGTLENGAPLYDGATSSEVLLDCAAGQFTYAWQKQKTSVKFYTKAEQAEKWAKPVQGSIIDSLMGTLCASPMRLTPVWAVGTLGWVPMGFAIQAASSLQYTDPGSRDIRAALEKFERKTHDAFGVTDLDWLAVNCQTHEWHRIGYFGLDASDVPVRVSAGYDPWKPIAPSSPAANLYVLLCDR